MEHKRQHWIPQSYLKAWADPSAPAEFEPWVWQFSKDGQSSKRRPPRKIFFETELYTLRSADGARDLTVEHGLAGLEDRFARIREQKLAQRLPLNGEEDLFVRAFVAAMQSRTPGQLEHWRSNWQRVAEMGRRVLAAAGRGASWPSALPGTGPSLSQDDVEHLVGAELGEFVFPMMEAQLPGLCSMNLTILETTDTLGFITSDAPCVWADPQMHTWPAHMRTPGLAKESVEISLPISPRQILFLTWNARPGYTSISERGLNELNRRTRWHANEHFVVSESRTRTEWFQAGNNSSNAG